MAAMNDYDKEAGGGRMMRVAAVVAYKKKKQLGEICLVIGEWTFRSWREYR